MPGGVPLPTPADEPLQPTAAPMMTPHTAAARRPKLVDISYVLQDRVTDAGDGRPDAWSRPAADRRTEKCGMGRSYREWHAFSRTRMSYPAFFLLLRSIAPSVARSIAPASSA